MKQRMTKITLLGLLLVVCITVFGQFFQDCQSVCNYAIGAIATICGLHNIGRGVEDGMTKFKSVSNGTKKGP